MDRAKFLMFAALAVACAGFVTLSQSVQAGNDNLLHRSADLGLVFAR